MRNFFDLAWKMKPMAVLSVLLLGSGLQAQATKSECVILLHGLARTSASMNSMQEQLQSSGYQVVNHDYPSRKETVQVLAESAIPEALAACADAKSVHFVTHSMGGILVRAYLLQHELPRLGRVVMLGPPNQGSEVVDRLANVPGFGLLNGPAGKQLGTADTDVPKTLGAVNFELGVIAGTRTLNPLLSQLLPNPDDGKVSVQATKVEGMTDFIALPVSHPLMMNNAAVTEQTLVFLEQGWFNDGQKPTKAP
jgi:pimeloyl-ACP methyl ester carboxylesterase